MIIYDTYQWAILLAVRRHGSVVPKTLMVAIPAGAAAAIIQLSVAYFAYSSKLSELASTSLLNFLNSFTSVLGFLIVFRTKIAYDRFWEAAAHLQSIRGRWFNVVSSCFAFCSSHDDKYGDVLAFQHRLVRLVSLLYGSALHEVAVMEDTRFEVLDYTGFDEGAFHYMETNAKKVEILMQWVQRLIVDMKANGTIAIEPPILSRCFQELACGVTELARAKMICRYPFPFPYAQIQSILLMFHWVTSVVIAGTMHGDAIPATACVYAFISTFCLWSINYISMEIEQPYGDDLNDLPMYTMQTSMNDSLANLLNPKAQQVPLYTRDPQDESIDCKLWKNYNDPNRRIKERVNSIKQGFKYKAKNYILPEDSYARYKHSSTGALDDDDNQEQNDVSLRPSRRTIAVPRKAGKGGMQVVGGRDRGDGLPRLASGGKVVDETLKAAHVPVTCCTSEAAGRADADTGCGGQCRGGTSEPVAESHREAVPCDQVTSAKIPREIAHQYVDSDDEDDDDSDGIGGSKLHLQLQYCI